MQAINDSIPTSQSTEASLTLRISVEFIAYALLIATVVFLRFASLGDVPFMNTEATQALPAYHAIHPDAPGTPQPAASPITLWLQMIAFSLLGGTELAARLVGVIGGITLTLMPLLFRNRIGREQTFWLSLLLGLSPVAFAASRTADPVIWLMIFLVGALWALWNYWESRQPADAMWLAGFVAAFLFLADAGAIGLMIVIVASLAIAFAWSIATSPDERDTPGDDLIFDLQSFVQKMPYAQMGGIVLLVIIVGGAGFFIYPPAMNSIAQLLINGLRDIVISPESGQPVWALLSAIVYNPLLIIFGVVGAGWLLIENQARFVERIVMAWFAVAFIALLLYQGSTPADALWLMLPAALLTSVVARELTVNHAPLFLYGDSIRVGDEQAFWWLKWLLSSIFVGLLVMFTVHIQEVGRNLFLIPSDSNIFIFFTDAQFAIARASLIWSVITAMFIVVVSFLLASLWGNATGLQAVGLGSLLFMLTMGVGTGWNITVTNANNPAELWHLRTPTRDAHFLRETLFEIADRNTLGFPLIPVTVVTEGSFKLDDSGLVAWLIRDFENAQFVSTVEQARQDEIVLIPVSNVSVEAPEPELGGSYVGQPFVLENHWLPSMLGRNEWLQWLMQRRVNDDTYITENMILWLRIDVYDDIPADARIR